MGLYEKIDWKKVYEEWWKLQQLENVKNGHPEYNCGKCKYVNCPKKDE